MARIDKWLWSVRIFKTRTIASSNCNSGKIKINGNNAKPSKNIEVGDIISVQKGPIKYEYKVLKILEKRVAAKLVPIYMEDKTTKEEIEKGEILQQSAFYRRKGEGRPTKKERRIMDKYIS